MTKLLQINHMLTCIDLMESEPMSNLVLHLKNNQETLPQELFDKIENALADLSRLADEIYEAGYESGKEETLEQCEKDYESGYDEGLKDGYDNGYEEGYEVAKDEDAE